MLNLKPTAQEIDSVLPLLSLLALAKDLAPLQSSLQEVRDAITAHDAKLVELATATAASLAAASKADAAQVNADKKVAKANQDISNVAKALADLAEERAAVKALRDETDQYAATKREEIAATEAKNASEADQLIKARLAVKSKADAIESANQQAVALQDAANKTKSDYEAKLESLKSLVS